MEPYEKLANAIILQAAKDYRAVLSQRQKYPEHKAYIDVQRELETFFRSRWFRALCDLEGEMLIQKLREEVVRS